MPANTIPDSVRPIPNKIRSSPPLSSKTKPIPVADRPPTGACEVNPRSILEAMLFVGLPGNVPLTAQQVAGLMRGVRPAEIDELVSDLNADYARSGRPYTIVSQGPGYRMTLREEFQPVRERLAGAPGEALASGNRSSGHRGL